MPSLKTSQIITALSAFAAGFAAGMLYAPQSGEKLRAQIADQARTQLRQAENRLKELESRMRTLEQRLVNAGLQLRERVRNQVSERMRNVADQTRDTILPALDDAADALRLDENEVSRDLRHMTRK